MGHSLIVWLAAAGVAGALLAGLARQTNAGDPPAKVHRKAPAFKPAVTVDAARKGHPISRYIYGQFIEHLGRCIYGGIWAEMVQDRKFFYAVGQKHSPWKATAGGQDVQMDKTDPFVGAQTPKIAAPGGIVQTGLGLVAGKKYVGHIWLKADDGVKSVDVTLSWGRGSSDCQTVTVGRLTSKYRRVGLAFIAGRSTDHGTLTIGSSAKGGSFHVGTLSLMPGDNVHGLRADTLKLIKELDAPLYRWPGGNFVSGYNWKDGIGDRDRRPPRKNLAWGGVEPNDFGLDEFMAFCHEIGAEPYITVNSGLGKAQGAAQEVQYANGAADTSMGKLRAANGHPKPYHVVYWAIGNEMYGNWQLGHMPLAQYEKKHNRFAKAMWAVDPSIKLIAVGASGPWTEGMLAHCGRYMDLLSEHFYCGAKKSLIAHVRQIADAIRHKADAHRRFLRDIPAVRGKNIPIAMDEWNYWYGPEAYGQVGPRYFLKDALGIAEGLNEYARQSDVVAVACYAQTVNVLGCIKTSKTAADFATTGLVLKLYRHHFGTVPLATRITKPLDAQAALSADAKTLTLGIVNPTMNKLVVPLTLKGLRLAGTGTRYQIAGNDPLAYNDPGKKPRVTIQEQTLKNVGKPNGPLAGTLTVNPCSVTLFDLAVK